jgi:hypothetical protein
MKQVLRGLALVLLFSTAATAQDDTTVTAARDVAAIARTSSWAVPAEPSMTPAAQEAPAPDTRAPWPTQPVTGGRGSAGHPRRSGRTAK